MWQHCTEGAGDVAVVFGGNFIRFQWPLGGTAGQWCALPPATTVVVARRQAAVGQRHPAVVVVVIVIVVVDATAAGGSALPASAIVDEQRDTG